MAPQESSSLGVAPGLFDQHRDHHHRFEHIQAGDSSTSASGCPFLNSQMPAPLHQQHEQQAPEDQQPSCSGARAAGVYQAWKLQRPVVEQCPRLTRQQLRRQGQNGWTMEEVAQHRFADDGWVVIDGSVYDITEHLLHHPGWDTGCGISTVISILAALGTDATQDFRAIHPAWSQAWKQLRPFYIGELRAGVAARAS